MNKPLRKAVLPVAGLGTRFLPATKAMAKEMLPVVDKPLIQYAIEEARAAGIEQFCLVTGRGKTAIVEHFDIAFELEATLRERDKPDVLGAARRRRLRQARWSRCASRSRWVSATPSGAPAPSSATIRSPILLPDDLILSRHALHRAARRAYAETGGNVVAVTEVPREQTNRYGILKIGERRRTAGRGARAWSKSRRRRRRPRTSRSSAATC